LVTLALAGYPQVSEASRKKILATARAMGYRPNPHARALRRGRTGIIALWIPDQISSHYTHVTRQLNRLMKAEQHELVVSEIGDGTQHQNLSHVPVDGVVAVDAVAAVRNHLESAVGKAVPIISIGAEGCPEVDSVHVDLAVGAREMMAHLLSTGRRRIVHATFMQSEAPGAVRRAEYVRAMTEAGLPPEFFQYPLSEEQRPIVRRDVQQFVRERGCPEAFFCHSDDVAIGIYRGLCDMGLKVPDQVALTGCDGIQDTEYLECPLSTLVQPVEEMCTTAWKFLTQRLAQPALERQESVLRPILAVRESTRARA